MAIVALAVANAGCSSEDPPVGVDATFEYRVRDFLEQALETGEVPIEVYNEAVDRAFRCLRDAGFEIEDWGLSDEQYGYPRREYGIPLEVEADPAEMRELWPGSGVEEHRCFAEHSSWVQFAYDAQPSSTEAKEARFEPYREAVLECMVGELLRIQESPARGEWVPPEPVRVTVADARIPGDQYSGLLLPDPAAPDTPAWWRPSRHSCLLSRPPSPQPFPASPASRSCRIG